MMNVDMNKGAQLLFSLYQYLNYEKGLIWRLDRIIFVAAYGSAAALFAGQENSFSTDSAAVFRSLSCLRRS